MNVSKTIDRIRRLLIPLPSTNQLKFVYDYCEDDFQKYHNTWLSISHVLTKNQDK
jgi:hypothetical protein